MKSKIDLAQNGLLTKCDIHRTLKYTQTDDRKDTINKVRKGNFNHLYPPGASFNPNFHSIRILHHSHLLQVRMKIVDFHHQKIFFLYQDYLHSFYLIWILAMSTKIKETRIWKVKPVSATDDKILSKKEKRSWYCELIYGSSASSSKFKNDETINLIFPWKQSYDSIWQFSMERVKCMRTYHFYSATHRVHFLRSRSKYTAPYIVLIVYVMSLDFFLNFKCVFIGIVRRVIIIICKFEFG